jgi:hypothetical protein
MRYPGTTPSDYVWDPTTNAWAFNPQARPGQTYVPASPTNNGYTPTHSGQTGWVASSDVKDPNGLFSGWTPDQWKSLAAFGAGAAVPIPAFGGAGGAGGAAGAAVPEIGTTTGLAGSGLGGFGAAGVGAGAGAAGTGTAATIGAGGVPSIPTTAGWAGSGFGGAAASSTPAWVQALQKYTNIGKDAGAVGQVLGAQQGGANNARIAQGTLNQGANNSLVNLYQAQNNAQTQQAQTDLARQQFATKNRSDVMRQALVGSLLGGGTYQPTHVSPTSSSGGILNSLNANPEALQALKTFGHQGSTAQNTPLTFSGGASVPLPSLAQTPQIDVSGGSSLTKAMQIIGALSGYSNLLGGK